MDNSNFCVYIVYTVVILLLIALAIYIVLYRTLLGGIRLALYGVTLV